MTLFRLFVSKQLFFNFLACFSFLANLLCKKKALHWFKRVMLKHFLVTVGIIGLGFSLHYQRERNLFSKSMRTLFSPFLFLDPCMLWPCGQNSNFHGKLMTSNSDLSIDSVHYLELLLLDSFRLYCCHCWDLLLSSVGLSGCWMQQSRQSKKLYNGSIK